MALNIKVGNEYKITSDDMNVILNRKHIVDPTKSPNWKRRKAEGASPDKRIEWREIGYFGTVEAALDRVVRQGVLESEAESISELTKEMRAIRREIEAVLAR